MKKKLLFSLAGLMACIALAWAAASPNPVLTDAMKLRLLGWQNKSYLQIVAEVGYPTTTATVAQDSIANDITRIENWRASNSSDFYFTNSDNVIATAKLAYDSITIQEYKNARPLTLAGYPGALTSTDYDSLQNALTEYPAATVMKGTKTVEDWMPGLKSKIEERMKELHVDAAYADFLTAIGKINAKTTEVLGGKANLHLGVSAVIKTGANDDYTYLKTIKETYTELTDNQYAVKQKHNIDSIYGSAHVTSLMNIYEAMNAAKNFLENDTVSKYALQGIGGSIPVTATDLVTSSILRGNFQNIHMIYQKVIGAPEYSEEVLKYIKEVLPETYLTKLHTKAVNVYKQKDRYIISDSIAREYVNMYVGLAPTKANYEKLKEAKTVYADWYVAGVGTSLQNLNHQACGHPGYVYASEALDSTELVTTGELAQKYIREKSATGETRVYRKVISDSLQIATRDTVAHSIAKAYKAEYDSLYNLTSVHNLTPADTVKLIQSKADLRGLADVGCSVEGAKEGRYYLWDGWEASTKEDADTMRRATVASEATDGLAIKNAATALLSDVSKELTSKIAAVRWLNKWDEFAHSVANLTDLKSLKLDSIDLALADYRATEMTARAKELVNAEYEILTKAKTEATADIVDAKIENLGFLYGNGVWVDFTAQTLALDGDSIPRSWKAINQLVLDERAKANKTDSLTILPSGANDSIKVAPRFYENAVAFVWGSTYDPTDNDVALYKDNVIVVDSWVSKTGRANKVGFNTYAPYQAPITVKANEVDLDLRVRQGKYTAFYVPFNIDKDSLALMNEKDMNVYYVGGAVEKAVAGTDSIEVDFGLIKKKASDYQTGDTAVYAYKPYFITSKNNKSYDTLKFKDVTIEITPVTGDTDLDGQTIEADGEGYIVCSGGKHDFTFVGSTQDMILNEDDYWWCVGDQTFYAMNQDNYVWTTGKGKRDKHIAIRPKDRTIHYAFKFTEDLDINATAIESVNTEVKSVKGIYTINGVKVKDMVKPGLYIVNGKKVLVK